MNLVLETKTHVPNNKNDVESPPSLRKKSPRPHPLITEAALTLRLGSVGFGQLLVRNPFIAGGWVSSWGGMRLTAPP